jgi:hypothetical protein
MGFYIWIQGTEKSSGSYVRTSFELPSDQRFALFPCHNVTPDGFRRVHSSPLKLRTRLGNEIATMRNCFR